MSSHSETTKPLSEDEIRSYIDVPPLIHEPWSAHLVDRLIATIRSLQARIRDLTVQIVNDEERSSFTAVLLARDERIGVLESALLEANGFVSDDFGPEHADAHVRMRKTVNALLAIEEADDG